MSAYATLVEALYAEREAVFGHDPDHQDVDDLVPYERLGSFDAAVSEAKLDELQHAVLLQKEDDAFEVLSLDNNDPDPEADPADRIGRFHI